MKSNLILQLGHQTKTGSGTKLRPRLLDSYVPISLLSGWESVCVLGAKVTRGHNFKMSCQIHVKCLTYIICIVTVRCPGPVYALFDLPSMSNVVLIYL